MKTFCTAVAAVALFSSWATAGTITLTSNTAGSTEGIGAFTGTMTYDDVSTLTITLTNTTSSGGSFITGLLFNIDGDAIATLSPDPTGGFQDLYTTGNLDGNPFGTFEAGAALGGSFLGNGNPTGGIAVGADGTFIFNVTGPDASSLTVGDFISQLSDGSGDHDAALLVRFRGGIDGQGSDKVPGTGSEDPGTPIPLPAAAWAAMPVFGMLGGKSLLRKLRNRRCA